MPPSFPTLRTSLPPLLTLLASLLLAWPAGAEERPLLAVMDIRDPGGVLDATTTNNLTEYLRGLLAETGRYVVIDRGRQAAAMKSLIKREKKESYKECYDRSCQVPLGRSLAADKLLITSILKIGSRVMIKAEIVDLATEASQGGATAKAAAEPAQGRTDRIAEALDTLVAKLVGAGKTATRQPATPPKAGPNTPLDAVTRLQNQAELQRKAWLKLSSVVQDERLPVAARLAAIDEFRARVGPQSPYGLEAEQLKDSVAGGPNFYRRKTEWASLAFNASTHGLGGAVGFFTLRWDRFYLTLIQGNWSLLDAKEWAATGSAGLSAGYPLQLGETGRHEVRLGVDLDLFMTIEHEWDDEDCSTGSCYWEYRGETFFGSGITPRATYVYHAGRHLSLQTGLELMLPVVAWDADDYLVAFGANFGVGF